jgi:hypothetical protein
MTINHCCKEMLAHIAAADIGIIYIAKFREYGIRYTDGGSSFQLINFCPWCGTKLAVSLRDKWFDEIERLGIESDDPNIPTSMNTEEWYLNMRQVD